MCAPGDIIIMYAPVAGKEKYHICLSSPEEDKAGCFLYLNSNDGYEADLVLDCAEIPCLPASETGKSVISCSGLVRHTTRRLELFRAKKLGTLSTDVAQKLKDHASTVRTLTPSDRTLVDAALADYLES